MLWVVFIAAFAATGVSWRAVQVRRAQLDRAREQVAKLDRAIVATRRAGTRGAIPSGAGTGETGHPTTAHLGDRRAGNDPILANIAKDSAKNRSWLQVSSDPKLHTVWAENERLRIEKYFGRLLRALPPEKAKQYLDLQVEGEYRVADIQSLVKSVGLSPDDPQVIALRRGASDELGAQEHALLGDNLYRLAQDVERSQDAEVAVAMLAGAVAFSDPLTTAQGDAVRNAFQAASPQYQAGGKLNLAFVNWPALLAQTQAVLSPGQYDSFVNGIVAYLRPRAEFSAGVSSSP